MPERARTCGGNGALSAAGLAVAASMIAFACGWVLAPLVTRMILWLEGR